VRRKKKKKKERARYHCLQMTLPATSAIFPGLQSMHTEEPVDPARVRGGTGWERVRE
jgi:hypothetical protein